MEAYLKATYAMKTKLKATHAMQTNLESDTRHENWRRHTQGKLV